MPGSPYIFQGTIRAFLFLLLFSSCSRDKQSSSDEMPPLYAAPQTIAVNTQPGYLINPVTGDSIQPIINSFGDTLKTGVPLQITGFSLDSGVPEKPVVVPAGRPEVVPVTRRVHKIPEELTIIPVNKDSLHSFNSDKDIMFPSILVNSTGDTILSGVPLPIKGRVVPCKTPLPVKALMPRIKDNTTINMKYLDVDQGMNSSNVTTIMEDSRGNLWFGTQGGGVTSFNGESFTHFTEKEGLSSNIVISMLEDRNGNLWFGTQEEGVCMYDGENFTHFTEKEGLGNNFVRSILEDQHGNLWFGTWGGGLILYDGKTITHFTSKEGFTATNIFSMVEDALGRIWIGALGGVIMYDGTAFTYFGEKEGLICLIVWCVMEDSQGTMWFGTNDGLSRYDGHSFTNYTEKEGLSKHHVVSMLEDSHGNLWFGCMAGGVSMYNGECFTHFGEKEGLINHAVPFIMEDSHGNIWFSTWGGGVSIYNSRILENFTEKEGLIDYGIGFMLEDSQDNLWFGSSGVGVSRFNGEVFKNFTDEQGIGTNFIHSILEDSHGDFWFGTDIGGLVRYDGKSFARFSDHGVFDQTTVKSMLEDSLGRLWLGTLGMGVICFDGVSFTHFSEREGFTNTNVESVLEDSQDNLWFSILGGGVTMYDGQDFTTFSRREGLSDNSVMCMLEDNHGNLWFGTESGGVNLYDGDSITYFTEKEGLSDNSVQSIVEDNDGNIWLGTLKGLNCLVFGSGSAQGNGNRKRPAIHNFNQYDGLKGMEFLNNSVELDSRNRLWWGTNKCLTMIDMNSFHLSDDPPTHLQLNRIEINGQYADFHHLKDHTGIKMEFDSVSRFNNYPLNLKLPYRNNHLTFYFSAIDWSAPHKIKYSYKMEGLKSNWSNPGEEAKADYRNLPAGTFRFKIRAIGEAQIWSEPFEYVFTIRHPWWFSWWAFSLYGLMLIGIILLYRRFLLRRAKLQSDVEIERIEKEKLLELDHMKSRFFANISHEFRTPLTLIIGPVNDLLNRRDNLKPGDRSLLGTMKRNAVRLQQLINQLLDLSRLETGKLKLEVSEGDLTGFIRSIVLSFLSLAESKKINYSHELQEPSFPVLFDRDKVEKIVTNLVSNALKFTAEGGSVKVTLRYFQDEGLKPGTFAVLLVRDTGPGIPAEQQEKIFDRFYQVQNSDSRNHEGSGIGLALVKELVELYRGEILVESIPGSGSTFTVKLPVSREQFREAEIFTPAEKQTEPHLPDGPDGPGYKVEESLVHQDQINKEKKEKPVILIVEDNPDLRDYIMQNLLGDYQILQAENGNTGLQKTIESIPDLVITDLMMPEMDGMEMCHRLKSDYRTNHIPLIMLTAKADRESKLESLQTGADDFILKPFDAEELKARVKNLIDQRIKLRERYRKELMADGGDREIPPPEDEFMVRVMNCMKKHLSESEFNVEQMGKELYLSRTQLYRKILAITDHTPGELIRSNRLKMAARMFQEGHRNVTSVMYSVGFDTSVNFAHHFRQMFGVNPSEYIRQNAPSKE